MANLLQQAIFANFRLAVQAYTWSTLPFYTLTQRPWQTLRRSKIFDIKTQIDSSGRTIYFRNARLSDEQIGDPLLKKFTLNEMIPHLDRSRKKICYRKVLSETPQIGSDGKPIMVDGRELKQIKMSDDFTWFTVGEVLDKVDLIAKGLHQIGVKSGVNAVLYAENSYNWYCTALSLQRLNAVTVTLLSILNDEGIAYGIDQSESQFIITSQELLPRLARLTLSPTTKIVYTPSALDPHNKVTTDALASLKGRGLELFTMDQIEEMGSKVDRFEFQAPNPKDVALIMYTSGTTGNPKGVMITHEQMMTSLHNIRRMDAENERSMFGKSRYSAYLPMAHLYGYLMNLGMFLSNSVLALTNPMTMFDNSPAHPPGQAGDFTHFKPTFLGAVPLVLERILKEINSKLESRSPLAPVMFNYLMDYKIRWRARGYETPIINRLVCKKIQQIFGGNFMVMLVGSAPLSSRTESLLVAALGVDMIQAYGATETLGACHAKKSWDLDYGNVGVPVQFVKFRLENWDEGGYKTSDKPNPRGEIVVGGPTIASGYYRMKEATDKAFQTDKNGERWYFTGDIGEVLPDGRLKIVDRKSDLTKLMNGEFVSLGFIESCLRSAKHVENICLCTRMDSNHIVALISPNRKRMDELADELGLQNESFEALCQNPKVKERVMKEMKKVAKRLKLKPKEIPVALELVSEEWNQDNNLLTAAFKMRRKQVNDFYRTKIDRLFDSGPKK